MRLMLHLNYIAPVFVYFLQCGFQNFEYTHTHTQSYRPVVPSECVCLDIGYLSGAIILLSDPLSLCSFFRTPHNRQGKPGSGMRSSLLQLSIPHCVKLCELSHCQVLIVVQAACCPLLGCCEQR